MIKSFDLGNVIKNGVPTVIAGKPNAGKSTLLNQLLNEDRAIVSEIPGTTRDAIEDEINIGGVQFRFIDTAGLRETTDTIEAIGVARAKEKMLQASLILFMFDLGKDSGESIRQEISTLKNQPVPFIPIGNKEDLASEDTLESFRLLDDGVTLNATSGQGRSQEEALRQEEEGSPKATCPTL